MGGTEIYLRNLVDAWRASFSDKLVLFVGEEAVGTFASETNLEVVRCPVRTVNRPARLLWEQLRLPGECRRRGVDVLLNAGFTAPLAPGRPSVTVFHDLQHALHPEWFRKADLAAWRFFLWISASASTKILCTSAKTRDDFLKIYRRAPSDAVVAEHGVDPQFRKIRWTPRTDEPYILCTSTTHPHKNFDRLLKAFARFGEFAPWHRLYITGVRGFAAEAVERGVVELGLGDRVVLHGWVDREKLYALFEGASATIYPTLFEGFGLPALESLAAGVPTACSDIEPLRSLTGDAAWRFDPHSDEAILDALRRACFDETLRARLAVAGPLQAAPFTWERTARLTRQLIEDAIASYGRRDSRSS